jgi:hypothetical protein
MNQKTIQLVWWALPLLLLLSLSACKKSKEEEGSRSDILSRRQWRLTTLTVNGEDVYDQTYPACTKDDKWIFTKEGNVYIDGGKIKCDPNESSKVSKGTWALLENDQQVTFPGGNFDGIVFDIEELTPSVFRLSATDGSYRTQIVYQVQI